MKRTLTAVVALSLLSGTAAMAQFNNPNTFNQNDSRNNQNRNDQNRNDQNRNDQNRNDQNRNERDRNDQGSNRDRRDNSNVRQSTPRWSRGDRLPNQYRQNQYVVNDWQQRGLRRPPRGYRWTHNDNNDFFLAAIATGIIAEMVYRDDRDQMWRQRYASNYTYNDDVYYRECRSAPDPAGVIVGALIGGLLGNAAGSGGGRTGATLAGVIVGGAVGAAL